MGASLVARCLLVPRAVPYPARWVLLTMCLHAMDRDVEPAYWGGWDTLAVSLGYPTYSKAAHRHVARCVQVLTEAGYIKAAGYVEATGNRVYQLTLPL